MRNDVCRFHIVLLKIVLAFVAGICVADADEPASDAPPSPTPSDGYHASIDYFYFIRDSSPRPARGIIPPLPSIESENKLLRVIRECKDKAKVFPYELVVHPVLSWDIRFDLTPSTFDVFHQYKEAVLDASYEDLLGCAYMIDELSEKEQAMVLVAIYLFEETRRIFSTTRIRLFDISRRLPMRYSRRNNGRSCIKSSSRLQIMKRLRFLLTRPTTLKANGNRSLEQDAQNSSTKKALAAVSSDS